jgi:hypothetical protein
MQVAVVREMVSGSDIEDRRSEYVSPTDRILMRLAAYFILEPIASALALGLLLGGIGGNMASFAFGVFVGLVAASILRQKHQDGRL